MEERELFAMTGSESMKALQYASNLAFIILENIQAMNLLARHILEIFLLIVLLVPEVNMIIKNAVLNFPLDI